MCSSPGTRATRTLPSSVHPRDSTRLSFTPSASPSVPGGCAAALQQA